MKKGTKVMVIIAGIFAAAGTGLCIGGVAMGATKEGAKAFEQVTRAFRDNRYPGAGLIRVGKTFTIYDNEEDWDEEITDSTEVSFAQDLEINLKYDELVFQEYPGDKIQVETVNDVAGDITVAESDGKVTITDQASGVRKRRKKVTVSVPVGEKFEHIMLSVDAGTIEWDSDLDAKNFSVEVGAGEFSGSGMVKADQCSLEVGAGTIELETLDARTIRADCGTGEIDIELAGKETDYNYELSCGMGEIDIMDSEYSGLGIEKTISNEGAGGKLTLNCGMGEINVDFSDESLS